MRIELELRADVSKRTPMARVLPTWGRTVAYGPDPMASHRHAVGSAAAFAPLRSMASTSQMP